jgi:predicted protein tyrosine phosphatase
LNESPIRRTDTQEETVTRTKSLFFGLCHCLRGIYFSKNINMNIVMAVEKKEDDNNKTIHTSNTQEFIGT